MSGIFGLLRLDGAPPGDLGGMAGRLARRGPEGTTVHVEGPVALGQARLAATPEALHEALPLVDPGTGCIVTADARLDNRDELLPALGLAGAGRVVGDGEIILRAYLAWGDAAPDRLLGDFALAIWDPRARRLLLARDHMGLRPLAYAHQPGRVLAFASEAEAVAAAPGLPRRLNERRVADFLGPGLEGADAVSTFFEGVLRLPPAHVLVLDPAGVSTRRYWAPTPRPTLRLRDDRAYAEAFLEVFTEAVRCRLRSAGPVGCTLSGGMDSGSIAAVASRLLAAEGRGPLRTVSVVGPDPAACPETAAIHASLAALPNREPTLLDWSDPAPWRDDVLGGLEAIAEPFDGHVNLLRALYGSAARDGVRVVLDGAGGDVVFSHSDRIPRLIRTLRLRRAWHETLENRRMWRMHEPAWQYFLYHLRWGLTPGWLRRLRLATRRAPFPERMASPLLAERTKLQRRIRERTEGVVQDWSSPSAKLARALGHPFLVTGRERYERVAAHYGIEPRDPFLDRRVVEFCLSLPSEQLAGEGWPKLLLRRAMEGLLPDEVRWKEGRDHLGLTLSEAALQGWPGWRDRVAQAEPRLRAFVAPKALSGFLDDADDMPLADSFDLLYLTIWMDRMDAEGLSC